MSRKSRAKNSRAPTATAPSPAAPQQATADALAVPVPSGVERADRVVNSFADVLGLGGDGLGGGSNALGYPSNQGNPYTAQVENVTTIFKNLRWYLISNMRQVLNQAYVEFGLVQTIVDVPVDDALRGGVTIKSKQLEESQIEELTASLDRDEDLITAGQAAKWNRLFGGAGVLILTDQDPSTPLELDQLGKGDPLEFRAVDMWELFWDKQNTEGYDPTIQEEDFEFYNYYGEQVHKSRVMRLKGLTAPSFIRPRLRGWGFSVVEILVRSINQYLKGTDLAFEVLDEFKIDVFKIAGLTQALASPLGEQQIRKRVQLANWEKNYNNALTMDKEDDWDHKQLSFAGLGDAMMQIRMQVASDMRMPLTKLFGISAAGFNSGEDDIEVYNAMVESQVRSKVKYTILRMIEIRCQQKFGFIPDDLSLEFEPLRVMSSEQEETVKTQQFARLIQSLTAGAISLKEFRDACNKGNLFDVTLDSEIDGDLLSDYQSDDIEGDDETGADKDDPGTDRIDTSKPTADSSGGVPINGPEKAKDRPAATDSKDRKPPKAKPSRDPSERDRLPNAAGLIVMPAPYTRVERAARVVNSNRFDQKSYEADGGDGWIDARRRHFFDRDKAQDPGLWDKATRRSSDIFGAVKWQFVVWFYKKMGGSFGAVMNDAVANNADWDEKKHPRADDGKFGKGSGKGGGKGAGKGKSGKGDDVEMIEIGPDGEPNIDLTEEQEATARARFAEAARGPEKKNPATESPEESSQRTHDLEKATRERAAGKSAAKTEGSKGFKSVFKGDEVEHTGKSETVGGRQFHEFVYTEGHQKGKKGLMLASESKKADVKKTQTDYDEQQAGFRRLRELEAKKKPERKS